MDILTPTASTKKKPTQRNIVKNSLLKWNTGWTQWVTLVILALCEANAGRSSKPRSLRPARPTR